MRRDAEQNRQKILAAARRLIAEQGLEVSHDQIAQAAGTAVGTVYRRFPTKDTLVTALFAEQVEVVVRAAEAALEVEDSWQALAGFLTATLELQAASRGLRELSTGSPHGRELARYARARIAPVVSHLVARAHGDGVLRADVAEQDLALIPVYVGAVIQHARLVSPDLWRRVLAVVLAGLRPAPGPPLPGPAPTSEQLAQIIDGSAS